MARKKALDNKCPNCGGIVLFQPSLKKFKCKYCDGEFSLEEFSKYTNASSVKNNNKEMDETSYDTYTCSDCGAEIVADSETAATFCLYCGNTAILKNKLSGRFAPDYIIPFKKEKKEAIEAFKALSKGRLFVPKDFSNESNIEKIRGIYIPFWLYDVFVNGSIEVDANRVNTWRVGDTVYTKTSYYKLYRTGNMHFFKVPVDGSTHFDNAIMNTIEPFSYEELIPYNHGYLAGFFAEKYDVNEQDAFPDAKTRCLETAKDILYNDCVGFQAKTVAKNNLQTKVESNKYVLLPVWMVNVKYKDKLYLFAMNGQTGEFIGDIPLDKKKVVFYAILLFLVLFFVIILISFVLYWIGRAS